MVGPKGVSEKDKVYHIDTDQYESLCPHDNRAGDLFICKEEGRPLDTFTLGSLYKRIRSLGYPEESYSLLQLFKINFKIFLDQIPDARVNSSEDVKEFREFQCELDKVMIDAAAAGKIAVEGHSETDDWLSLLTPHTLNRLASVFGGDVCRDEDLYGYYYSGTSSLSFEVLSRPERVAGLIKQFGDRFVKFLHATIVDGKMFGSGMVNPNQYIHLGDALVYLIENHADKISAAMLRDIMAFEQRIDHPELREALYGNEEDPPSPILKAKFDAYHAETEGRSRYEYVELLTLALQRGHPDAVEEMRETIAEDRHHILAEKALGSKTVWAFLNSAGTKVLPHLQENYRQVTEAARLKLPELLRQPSFHVIELIEILGDDLEGMKNLQAVEEEYRAQFEEAEMAGYRPLDLVDYSRYIAQQTEGQYISYRTSEKYEKMFEQPMVKKMVAEQGVNLCRLRMHQYERVTTGFDPEDWTNFLGGWNRRKSLKGLPSATNALQAIFHLINFPCIATADALEQLKFQSGAYEGAIYNIRSKIDEALRTENEDSPLLIARWEQEIARLEERRGKITALVSEFFDRQLDVAALSSYIQGAEGPAAFSLALVVTAILQQLLVEGQEPAKLYALGVLIATDAKDRDVVSEMIITLKVAEERHAYASHNIPPHAVLARLAVREGKIGDLAWNALKEVITTYWNGLEPVPGKSGKYILDLVDVATTANPHAVEAVDMLLDRFDATKDFELLHTLQQLDTAALEKMLPPIGSDSPALKTIRRLAFLRNARAVTVLINRFAAGDVSLAQDMKNMLSDAAFADAHAGILDSAVQLCVLFPDSATKDVGWDVVTFACEENVHGAWGAVADLYTTFTNSGDQEQADRAIWTILNLESEPGPEHAQAIFTLDQGLASLVGYPETVDDELDPRFEEYLGGLHGADLTELVRAVADFKEERERLINEQQLLEQLDGYDSSAGTPVTDSVLEEGAQQPAVPNTTSPFTTIRLDIPSSGAGQYGMHYGTTTYPVTVPVNAVNATETTFSAGEAPITSGTMLFASPAQILEAGYAAVLAPFVSDSEKKQYIDVIANIAMGVPLLQGTAIQLFEDIVLTQDSVSPEVRTYALNTLITMANSGHVAAGQGLLTLVDDAYSLAQDGSEWERHVIEIVAEKGAAKYSAQAKTYLEQLDTR